MTTQLSGITQSHLLTNQDEEMNRTNSGLLKIYQITNNYSNMYNLKIQIRVQLNTY